MAQESPLARVARLAEANLGVVRGRAAVGVGMSRKQIAALLERGLLERVHPDTYRFAAVARCSEQDLRAALAWAGDRAAAAGRSAGELYHLEGVRPAKAEIVVPRSVRARSSNVIIHRSNDRSALMIRTVRGLRVTGIEATLVALAHGLDPESLEIACEDARRRRLTSMAALTAYLERFGIPGRRGVRNLRRLLAELDPVNPSRSTLEVKTRRLLVAHGITDFAREFPLDWNGRTYRYDFAFPHDRVILETNGRRWHDDPADYEADHEKWSVPGRHGFRILFATWERVTRDPARLVDELRATLTGARVSTTY
jgi:very-short-patch-repair endonuclease